MTAREQIKQRIKSIRPANSQEKPMMTMQGKKKAIFGAKNMQ